MKIFSKQYHLPKNFDILLLLVVGILLQMADGSPFSLKVRWSIVWETELPSEFFSMFLQKFIKMLLSAIVVVRCSTTYAYVVSAMLVIFCLIQEKYPKLMLLWLLVAGVKSLSMTFLEALIGVYICSAFGKIHKACIEFFISKALELIFSALLWGNVLNIYGDMERSRVKNLVNHTKEQIFFQKADFRRPRARSLVDESTLYRTACLNNFKFKDVPQIILQMLRKSDETSEDSLLAPGMMLASVSNLGSFDSLKTSQSLGELGFVNLETAEVVGLDEDEPLSFEEKALRFLKLTPSDVKNIKSNKTPLEQDIFTIDKNIWKSVADSEKKIYKPSRDRNQIFIHDLLQTISDHGKNLNKKNSETSIKFCYSELIKRSSSSFYEKEIQFDKLNDEDDYSAPSNICMSNIKMTLRLRARCQKRLKTKNYYKLLKKEFMFVIGPEVFDRAPKLPKVTSLTVTNDKRGTKISTSLPALNIQNFEVENEEKIYETSNSDSEHNEEDSLGSFSGEKIKYNKESDTTTTEKIKEIVPKDNDNESKKALEVSRTSFNVGELEKTENKNSYYRKRRILIIRKNKVKRMKMLFSSTSPNFEEYSEPPSQESFYEPPDHNGKSGESPQEKSILDDQTLNSSSNKQIYFSWTLFNAPLSNTPASDFKNTQNGKENLLNSISYHSSTGFTSFQFNNKSWKSKVLKTVELTHLESFSSARRLTISSRRESLMRKLLKYQIASLVIKNAKYLRMSAEGRIGRYSAIPSEEDRESESSIWDNEETDTNDLEVVESCSNNEIQNNSETEIQSSDVTKAEVPEVSLSEPRGQDRSLSQESDEPISLFYSKAADLSSPLFDMKRFIYPDHIHYSYKHVNKKGFDVDINGDLPLLLRESLTMRTPIQPGNLSKDPEFKITRRPMDLSFASSNAFAEWKNNEQNDAEIPSSSGYKWSSTILELSKKSKKGKSSMKSRRDLPKPKLKSYEEHFNKMKKLYSVKDYLLIEKLLRMHKLFNDNEMEKRDRKPTQISSTQLHSNKDSTNSTYNPGVFLQENKSRSERRKPESQHQFVQKCNRKFSSERTKDMFARLEREVLLQRKNFKKSTSSQPYDTSSHRKNAED